MIRSVRSDIEIFAKENVFIKDEFYIAISGKKKNPLFCPMLTLNIKSTNLTANLSENIKIRFSGTFTGGINYLHDSFVTVVWNL